MSIILAGIESLTQHLSTLKMHPHVYRPDPYPGVVVSGLGCHGTYTRLSDRGNPIDSSLNPIPIPRFLCSACQQTCSTLPECIPPRRWYLWCTQQAALSLLLSGHSVMKVCDYLTLCGPCESTLSRWWLRLRARFDVHAASLRARFPEWAQSLKTDDFWRTCRDKL